jgi:hypothetical protein
MSTFPPALSTLRGGHHRAPVVRPFDRFPLRAPGLDDSSRAVWLTIGSVALVYLGLTGGAL